MAGELDRAMGRLKHRDIRTRRRAVRTLVELEDPESLKAFKSLLNDEDSWFVSKALDAYRRWAPIVGLDAVEDLTSHSSLNVRRCGANLLDSLGEDGISTATMIKLGRVRGNKMVDMQLSNHKLVLRAIRMVREATGVSDEVAAELLEKHGSVRNAVDAIHAK